MTDILIAPRGATLAAAPQVPQPSQRATPMTWKRRLTRFGILGAIVAGVATAAAVLPVSEIADKFAQLGPAAAVAIAVVGGLLLSVLVPRTAITLACGALLGAATGAATALAAAVIAAAATYYAGRWVGRGALSARTGGKLERLDGWLNRRGLSAVLLVRFLPLAPFGLIGYAYGTTSVCRKRYLLGTTLASIPSAVSYAVIGAAVMKPGEMSPLSLAPALIGFTLTTGIVLWWKRSAKKTAAA
ncbi:TVP38/TMEM64 family protein [Actinoplanes solisilvae]|uniref:TVP38/TMEM64 family protein n=1 Tax=Actinoplanes solisilvae TaxID=2486853 RepID=UPI000FD77A7B|nr:VTT domain-containing protein [Actinoplanes solisilvae]